MNTDQNSTSALPIGLQEVLATELLRTRPARAPDYAVENQALVRLARQLATSPHNVLQQLADTAMELCRAGSAGISIEELNEQGQRQFQWHAVAGAMDQLLGARLPRDASPCGFVLDRNEPQLMVDPARYYKGGPDVPHTVTEALLVPFHEGGRPVGTLWVISHDPQRQFDGEDARLMTSLSEFAALARQAERNLEAAQAANATLKQQQLERDALLSEAERQRTRLYEVFDKAPAFMAVLNGPEHIFELVNDRFYQTVGHRELIGRSVREALPEIATQGYLELLDKVYRTGEVFVGADMRIFLQRQAEQPLEERFVEFIYQPLIDVAGRVTGILALGIDLSERKQAEAALRASEERYRSLFNSIDEGFCLIELMFDSHQRPLDYRFLEANPMFENHTGMRDVIGKTARELLPGLDEYWFETYGRVALTGQPVRFVHQAPSMNGRWFDVYAFRLGGDESRKVALLFTDNTERKRVEQAIEASESRLQLAIEIGKMGTFEIDLTTDVVEVNEPGREIYGWESRFSTFTQVQSHFHPDDRDQVMNEVAAALAPGGSGTFDVEQPPSGAIHLTVVQKGYEVVVTVKDTGIGIPAESLPMIFEMFSQVDRRIERTTGGLGIGLALVRGLVMLHGGSVVAESPGPGKGTTVTVRLPALPQPRQSQTAAPVTGDERTAPFALHVLVVDDNRDSCITMATLLQLLGNQVDMAFDGIEAVEQAEQLRPDVILMDIGMPRLNGYDATRRIRALPGGDKIQIVALTGWGQDADRTRSLAAGCDGHLVKPVSREDLERTLTELVDQRKHRNAGAS